MMATKLYETEAEALAAKQLIDRLGCRHACRVDVDPTQQAQHAVVDLRDARERKLKPADEL